MQLSSLTFLLAAIALPSCNGFTISVHSGVAPASEVKVPKFSFHQSTFALHMSTRSTTSHFSFELPEDDDSNDESMSSCMKRSGISSSELRLESNMSEARRARLEAEEEIAKRFVTGDELHLLRQRVLNLRNDLHDAREHGDVQQMERLGRAILQAQQMDAEFIYEISLERMEAATQAGLLKEADSYRREALLARSALPQFNLEGLWIGRFGEDFQMVNVSYVGDVLIAHKVTGDRHVPKGEISFQVDLSPKTQQSEVLEPIELDARSKQQWGSQFLQRFAGMGQVASQNYSEKEWLEGQLILVNNYFSFAWLPIGRQVFFGRPSAELTLKMLRESRFSDGGINAESLETSATKKDNDEPTLNQMRAYLHRCMDETEHIQDEMEVSEELFCSHDQGYYYDQEGCFE